MKDFPNEERLITIPEDARICKRCGNALVSMGREKIRIGIALPRATLANWVIRSAQDWLIPLVDHMHKLLLRQPIIVLYVGFHQRRV